MSEPGETPLIPTPEALVQRAIEQLQATYPNWNPNPASPEYRMFLAFAAICAETIILAFDIPEEEIVRVVGELVYQTQRIAATSSTATSTWEAIDNLGHAIPVGTQVLATPSGGSPVAFEVTEEAEIKAGETTTAAGAVKLRAVEPGTEGNIPGAAEVVPSELIAWVQTITLATAPADGTAEETTQAFVQRIRELAKIFKPQPILPADFANYVRLLVPGIQRCVAIDMLQLKPHEGHSYGSNEVEAEEEERCVTVIPLTADGTAPPEATLKEAWERLDSAREATFRPFIGVPTVHTIEVKVVGKFFKGFTGSVVKANVVAALQSLLDPANWGVPATGDTTSWVNKKTLRYQDVVTALNNCEGFNYYTELKVNSGEADVALSGIAPLVEAGTLTVTLTEGPE